MATIERLSFDLESIETWAKRDARHQNWPVVYALDRHDAGTGSPETPQIYIGESLNAAARMRQHLSNESKKHLNRLRVVLDEEFNKSVCLDLESYLIQLLAGDGQFEVLNRNAGVWEADYFDRDRYRSKFQEIFDSLRDEGLFTRTIPEIRNSDLFKLSPFKALTTEQALVVEDIVEGLLSDVESNSGGSAVINGAPGTGKTIVAIYLMKLLRDIGSADAGEEFDIESVFADFFTEGNRELVKDFRMALVVPQQSLRESIKRVFRKTPGLHPGMVLSAYQAGEAGERFDLLIVDEAHRLTQRGSQSHPTLTNKYKEINRQLFGKDDHSYTQLDWIRAQSTHQIFLVDKGQSVRPLDVPSAVLDDLDRTAQQHSRWYRLESQMRVRAGDDYVGYMREVLNGRSQEPKKFDVYDLRFFDDFNVMHAEIQLRESESGLARLVAGYAWKWVSATHKHLFDINIDGTALRWNTTAKDWINSPTSINEVGSIHTVQGYDLNYAGVIIGEDLRYSEERGIHIDRSSYFDTKGKQNNNVLGITYSDEDLRELITNIYGVLLTRGIRGTYIYVCDPRLREYLRPYFLN